MPLNHDLLTGVFLDFIGPGTVASAFVSSALLVVVTPSSRYALTREMETLLKTQRVQVYRYIPRGRVAPEQESSAFMLPVSDRSLTAPKSLALHSVRRQRKDKLVQACGLEICARLKSQSSDGFILGQMQGAGLVSLLFFALLLGVLIGSARGGQDGSSRAQLT